MPQGGYYVIEITGGFVNNSIVDNTLNLTGKSSTGIQLDGEDYGTLIAGNQFIGGTTYNTVYTGMAISLGAAINSAASGDGSVSITAGWTALPNLGAVIEDNTIEDSARWNHHRSSARGQLLGGLRRHSFRDRACLSDGDR